MSTKPLFGWARAVTNRCWSGRAVAASALASVLYGCGAAAEEQDEPSVEVEAEPAGEADLGTAVQRITGGTLVTGFSSVVKIVQGGSSCTASKLMGTNKFLTAAHCISNPLATSLTLLPNADGSSGQIPLSIPSGGFQIHPSYTLRNGVGAFSVYDIAVVTTTTPTPNIVGLQLPSSESPPPVPSSTTGIGFGCDNSDSTHTGKRQSGAFDLTGGTLDHVLTSSGPDTVCPGDSGGPLLSNADGSIIGVTDLVGGNLSAWSRTASIRSWIIDPKPGNDPSLFQNTGDLFFMHNKKVNGVPIGLCMVANSNIRNPPSPVSVLLDKCSDPFGRITGKGSGWTIVSVAPAGRFVIMNRATSQCLTPSSTSTGADLQAATCDFTFNTSLQKWFFTRSAASPFATVRIKNHSTNHCMSTDGAGTALGTKIEQALCDAGLNDSVQSWVATK